MKLAFHDASVADANASANGAFFDRIIQWFTRSPYVHVELVFDDSVPAHSLCFSAVPGDGVRFTILDLTLKEWRLIDLPDSVTPEKCRPVAESYRGERYDWLGILGFSSPFADLHMHDDRDKFCNEVCIDVLQRACGMFPHVKAWCQSPGDLYRMVAA